MVSDYRGTTVHVHDMHDCTTVLVLHRTSFLHLQPTSLHRACSDASTHAHTHTRTRAYAHTCFHETCQASACVVQESTCTGYGQYSSGEVFTFQFSLSPVSA
eukprot:scpid65667/ scgid26735/ 